MALFISSQQSNFLFFPLYSGNTIYGVSIAYARCVFVGHSRSLIPSKTPLHGETP